MIFRQFRAGGDRNFSYLIADESTREAAVVDPGTDPGELLRFIEDNGLKIVYIINTHDHFDHTGGNARCASGTSARIAMHESARSRYDTSRRRHTR